MVLKYVKKKNLKSQNWLRQYKTKQYPWWRIDKPENVKVIKDGGWHFSFLYDVDGIIKKISSYQHTEFDVDAIKNKDNIITFKCVKMRNGEETDFTSTMDWATLTIGPETGKIQTEEESDEDPYDI